jgi:hypothetical protein
MELDGCALISYADAKPPNQHVQDLALGPRDELINRTPESQRYILLFYRQSGQPSNHLAEMPAVARPKAVRRNRRSIIIGTNLPNFLISAFQRSVAEATDALALYETSSPGSARRRGDPEIHHRPGSSV